MNETVELLTFLVLVLSTLKLADFISWPWVWILSPLWIPALMAIVFSVAGLIQILIESPEAKSKRHARKAVNKFLRSFR